MNNKKWWKSKTLWINLIAVGAIIVQIKYGFIVSPEEEIAVLAVVNLIVRAFTKTGLSK